MPGVPIDPYFGEPLRMAVIDGKPVIYSVGPDGQDDQASIEWNLIDEYLHPRKKGDFVFRLESLPQ
jgi:hypothetical protein